MSLHSLMFAIVLVGAALKIGWSVYKLASGSSKALRFGSGTATTRINVPRAVAWPTATAQTADAFGLSLAVERNESDEPDWQQYYGTSADWT